jgi:hypothetical protein
MVVSLRPTSFHELRRAWDAVAGGLLDGACGWAIRVAAKRRTARERAFFILKILRGDGSVAEGPVEDMLADVGVRWHVGVAERTGNGKSWR